MSNSRGFTFWLYLAGVGLALVALWYAYETVEGRGYDRGAVAVRSDWDKANRKAEEAERDAERGRQRLLEAERKRAATAEAAANESDSRWKEARDEARRSKTALAKVVCPTGTSAPQAGVGTVSGDSGGVASTVVLTWEFVGLYDSAWTSSTGQPVFGTVAEILARAGTPAPSALSPYGLEEVLDRHKANANRCSALSREYTQLITSLRELSADWDQRFKQDTSR